MDNSVIGQDDFDPDRILNEMLSQRPVSTTYQDVIGHQRETVPPQERFMKREKKFNLGQFNEHFDRLQREAPVGSTSNELPVSGISDFDELGGAATVVSDGQYVFVQAPQKSDDPDDSAGYGAICSFGLLKEYAEYDRGLEKERYGDIGGIRNDKPVSDRDLQKFSRLYESCGDAANQRELTKQQFADRMRYMEARHQENLISQRHKNHSIINAQMQRLSDTTRANLQNHALIEGVRFR